MTTDQEQFQALFEKHKADDQPKVFFFEGMYYKMKRDEYNVMDWSIIPMSVERYNNEISGIPPGIRYLPHPNTAVVSS